MMIVLGLLGICVQVGRMMVREQSQPDTALAEGESERLVSSVEREAREVEKFVNGTLRSDVRKEFLRLFWDRHEKVVAHLRRARLRDTMASLVRIGEIEERIADGIEKGRLRNDGQGIDVLAATSGICRNYTDRVMRHLGPHLRHETFKRVGEATGRRLDANSGTARRAQEAPARPSARDTLRRR